MLSSSSSDYAPAQLTLSLSYHRDLSVTLCLSDVIIRPSRNLFGGVVHLLHL